jgi:hypothetical protein
MFQNIDAEPQRHRRFIKKHPIVLNSVKKKLQKEKPFTVQCPRPSAPIKNNVGKFTVF